MGKWLGFAVLAFGGAVPAAAMCMGPRTVLSPASGAVLPVNPSLFLFVPSSENQPTLTARTEAGELPMRVTELSSGAALTTYRLDVDAPAGSSVTVRVQDPQWEPIVFESHYTVSAAPPATGGPFTVVYVAPEISSWTCSFQESHNVGLSHGAPAFHIEWSNSESDYHAGIRDSVVVPADMNAFFGASGPGAVLELGHVNCFGYTVEWSGAAPIYVGVSALHADGSVQPVTTAPLELHEPERPLSQWLMEDYVGPLFYHVRHYLQSASVFFLP